MPPRVNVVDPATGKTFAVEEAEAARLEADGWQREGAAEKVDRLVAERREEEYGGAVGAVTAAGAGALRTVTGGLSDVAFRALGEGDDFAALREVNPGASLVGEIGGAFIPVGAVGAASRAGSAITKTAEGASALTKLGRAAGGAAVEGAILGAGTGVSEVALSQDPATIDRVISSIGSNMLLGGGVGAAAGVLTKAAGLGLQRAQGKLDDIAAAGATQVDDTAKLALRDEVAAFRKELKQTKPWSAIKDDELYKSVQGLEELRTVGKRTLKADKALDSLLDDPKALVANPQAALRHLRVQESALAEVAAKSDDIRAFYRAEASTFAQSARGPVVTKKLAALDQVAPALERNRMLQQKIEAIVAKPAVERAGGIGANMLGGQAFGLGASIAGAIPVVGPLLAPIAGAAASKAVTEGFAKLSATQAARASKAVGTLLAVTEKAARPVTVLSSKVLGGLAYGEGPARKETRPAKGSGRPTSTAKLARAYESRTSELKELTRYDELGNVVMRPAAREKIAARLADVRAIDPIVADRMETGLVRKYEYLASMLPRAPDVAGRRIGPSTWRPSEMKIRAWARIAHAVEDPIGVVERLAGGSISPEEAQAFRAVYPELHREIQEQIWAQLPSLRATLPYQKQIALSIFSGVAVSPAMDPRVRRVLQASFAAEPASEGGTQAPRPQPQFGSVRAEQPTPSQERAESA